MENQTENTNVTYENQQQFEPLHKSFCRECGTMISEKADICPNCGAAQHRVSVINDTPSAGLKVLSFFIPLAGLILFVVQSIYLIFKFVVTTLSAHRQSQLHFSITMWAERLWNLL